MSDKLKKLTVYADKVKGLLESAQVPAKHVRREKEYKAFLSKEYAFVSAQIEEFKLEGTKK